MNFRPLDAPAEYFVSAYVDVAATAWSLFEVAADCAPRVMASKCAVAAPSVSKNRTVSFRILSCQCTQTINAMLSANKNGITNPGHWLLTSLIDHKIIARAATAKGHSAIFRRCSFMDWIIVSPVASVSSSTLLAS